jgi:predicted acylesterase/phospholipase RssA
VTPLRAFTRYSRAIALAALALAGCATFPRNPRLERFDPTVGYRFDNLRGDGQKADDLFVVLAFSGGGTRAAALSYGVLEELRDTPITWHGQTRRLLDEVDLITSVSGGSFTAAYYGLNHDQLFDGEFERRFLKQNIESELKWQLVSIPNLVRLASPYYGRSDLAAAYYDETIFAHKTYADLVAGGRRPWIMLLGADMTLGAPFPFIQDQFDLICSDLSGVPVARAVTSSSAFPGLLSALTYQNYAGTCDYKEPLWLGQAEGERRINAERAVRAERQRSYYAGDAPQRRPFVHTYDGGVADNIGLREVLYAIKSTDPNWSILRLINDDKIDKLVVIVVNAATSGDNDRDTRADVPDLFDTVLSAANSPMDNYSFDTVRLVEAQRDALLEGPKMVDACNAVLEQQCPGKPPLPSPHAVDVYVAEVAFDLIPDTRQRHYFRNLPTNFNLPADTVDALKAIGHQLLRTDPEFQQLLTDLRQPRN